MLQQATRERNKNLNDLDNALFVSSYFGFLPIKAPSITQNDIELTRHCGNNRYYNASEKMAIMRTYVEQNFASLPHPLALIYKKPISRKKFGTHDLHLFGLHSGVAEATLIRTTLSILSEEGYKNLRVDINCVGDKESMGAYERELTNFVRRLGIDLSDELKQRVKEDIFNLFRENTEEALHLREMAPPSINFLSAPNRIYFKEVLEYMEALGIEFRLAPELIGEKNHTSHTIFSIKNTEAEESVTMATGYRFSRLARLLGLRKEIPVAGVTLFPVSGKMNKERRVFKNLQKSKFYLVQLGQAAKIKSLSLLELLRKESIAVHHLIGKDQITVQFAHAEDLRVSHLIIIGQKEALDNTATVRNVATHAQDTVSIIDLPRYLKNIKL